MNNLGLFNACERLPSQSSRWREKPTSEPTIPLIDFLCAVKRIFVYNVTNPSWQFQWIWNFALFGNRVRGRRNVLTICVPPEVVGTLAQKQSQNKGRSSW
ncbi:ribosomal protein S2 [Echinococcus multilocularis]|uniref:Ribosomal protein S2 n=1 Tax=Echinococcus multilocularis TaxID=6211 RepID=A0A0S4MM84_ECHMU|nr:ribosomal protein S2 [Echinococcus multilocularis]